MPAKPSEKTYDEIVVGDHAEFSVTVTEKLIGAFAEISGDTNSLHMDEEYAVKTFFGHRIAHGMLIGSFFSQLVGMRLPGVFSLYISQSLRFHGPVFIGTELNIRGEVTHKSDSSKTITIHTTAKDAGLNNIFVDGEAMVQLLK